MQANVTQRTGLTRPSQRALVFSALFGASDGVGRGDAVPPARLGIGSTAVKSRNVLLLDCHIPNSIGDTDTIAPDQSTRTDQANAWSKQQRRRDMRDQR